MANFADFTMAAMDAANGVAGVLNDYNHKQAALSTQTKNIQLQNDINGELARIRQSNNFEDWNKEINDFYERVKSGMGNKDSPYYCQNNLQAEQFQKILDQSQVSISDQVGRMVQAKQQEKNIVDTENSIEQIFQMYTGQEAINKANESVKLLYDTGAISLDQYDARKDKIYQRAYMDMHTKVFDDSFNSALERGKSKEAFWQDIKNSVPELKATDTYGLEKTIDKTAMDEKLKNEAYQFYNARLSDIQQGNANKLSEIFQKMQQQKSAEGKVYFAQQGQREMNNMMGLQLSENDRIKYANYFKLEEYYGSGARGSSSQRKAAADKLDVQDYMDFYFKAIENGDASTVYNAWKDCQDDMLEEYKNVTGNSNASIVDLEKEYPKIGTFLKTAKNHLPAEFQDVIAFAQNVVTNTLNTKGNDDAYKEEINSTLELVHDIVFDADIKNAGPEAKKELKTRVIRAINANLGGVLEKQKDYKEYFGKDYAGLDTLSDYREGVIESKEARMAKAMKERDANPDLVYTKANGVEVPYAMQEGLARLENDERSELKDLIKSRTGIDVSDGDIKMSYESDGRNDVTARRRYTINGVNYRFRTEDGKHIILEEKKNGTKDWQTVKTVSQQNEYDSPKAVAKRTETEVESIINKKGWKKMPMPENGFTYTDEDGKQQKLTYTDPEGEEKVINQTYWKHLRSNEKKRIIMDWMEKEPEAAKKWLDMLDSK